MDVEVKFLGAAGSVTGSRYLVRAGHFCFLFDCGLFQGLKELRLRNWDAFPIDPASIDAVIISHAHIDHCGYLPALVRNGFTGPVYCTTPTAELLEIMLLDSARLQEEEAEFAQRKGYSKHAIPKPLYTQEDAKKVFHLVHRVEYGEIKQISAAITILFRDAGHLLGSAITEVWIQGERKKKKIVFSGDLGRYNQQILNPPSAVEQADVLFIESTYGNKDNPFVDPEAALERIVNETFSRGGVLVIPAFAVGRTQALLYYLHKLIHEKRIPDVPVYVDSPMAISATYLFYKYPTYHRIPVDQQEIARELETNRLVFVKTAEHSKSLNAITSKAIIIASSGMMTGGRIVHHLYNRLRNPQDTLLVCGYQAEGTRGRKLLDHMPTLRMFGEDVPVECHVEVITSMSGHADKTELFQWMSNFKTAPEKVFTVHGEGKDIARYTEAIRARLKWNVSQASYLETAQLFSGI